MKHKLFAQSSQFLPEFMDEDREGRAAVTHLGLISLYTIPLGLLALIWLLFWTPLVAVDNQGFLFILLFAWRYLLSRLNFSRVGESEHETLRGANGRFVSWSAVFVLGPLSLWADLGVALIDIVRMGYSHLVQGRFKRHELWGLANHFFLTATRDVLPALLALWFWLPGSVTAITTTTAMPAIYITLVHMGLSALLSGVPFLLIEYDRDSSRWYLIRELFRFGLTLVLIHVLPEMLAVLVVGFYGGGGLGVYGLLLAAFLAVGVLAHYLNRQVVDYERHSQQLHYLERLAQAILQEPSDNRDLSHLLGSFLPQLYPDEWMEIRLLPAQILYFQGEGWVATENDFWQEMVESERLYWQEAALLEAVAQGYASIGLLVPIRSVSEQAVIGGIYVLPRTAGDGLSYLDRTQTLAGYIAAHIHRVESYHEVLTAQADAYKKEIYAQVYQSEVVVQTLAYERMEKELLVAGKIQSTMLPQHLPELPGWQLSVVLEPARETSGDFYDFIPLPNGRIGLIVADVADKGVGAALYMALSRTLIRVFARDYGDNPAQALAAANQRILSDTNSDLFVTVLYIVLDPENGRLTYCNAGHPPPFILSGNGVPPQALTGTGLPLGIFDDVPWQEGSADMQRGDVLVLYTDGVTEAENETADFFGEGRLQAITRKFINRSPAVIESKILDTIYDFMGEAPQHDDITLMIVTRESMPK